MTKVLFAAGPGDWETFVPSLRTAFQANDLNIDMARDHPSETVDYVIYAPSSGLMDLSTLARCKAVLSLWAGVESIVGNPTLTRPLARMVDPGLTEGMVEYVTGHVLRYHLGIDAVLGAQDGNWTPVVPPLARHRRVGILGLGALGSACAAALTALNFDVAGWSRTAKTLDGIACHCGDDGLSHVLARSDILVLLLPLTEATTGLIDKLALAAMPKGARLINPGRGPLIDDTALLAALETGPLAHATLDVFATEPLPKDHPFWRHPNVTVTPHIASATRPETAAMTIAENIRRGEAGEPFLNLVDRARGY